MSRKQVERGTELAKERNIPNASFQVRKPHSLQREPDMWLCIDWSALHCVMSALLYIIKNGVEYQAWGVVLH